jgi:hypothetical protein
MRAFRVFVPAAFLTVLLLSCKTSGDVEPIVIDFSAHRTPTPTPGIVPAPTEPPPSPAPAPVTSPPPRPAEVPTAPRTVPTPAAVPGVFTAPERVAENYEAAYNRRDLEAIATFFSADAQVFEPPDQLRSSGVDQIRRSLASHFSSNPRATRQTSQRFTQGRFVVERLTESADGATATAQVVISEIRDGKIVRMWILR